MEGFDTLKRLTKDQPVWIEFSVEQAVYDAVEQFLRRFELSVEEAVAAYIIELVKMRDQIIFEYDSGKAPEKILANIADNVLFGLIRKKQTGGSENVKVSDGDKAEGPRSVKE